MNSFSNILVGTKLCFAAEKTSLDCDIDLYVTYSAYFHAHTCNAQHPMGSISWETVIFSPGGGVTLHMTGYTLVSKKLRKGVF